MISVLDVELTRSRLDGTVQELTRLLHRSAYSTLMRESRDCSFLLFADTGEVVVNGLLHLHCPVYRKFAMSVIEQYPDMREGDMFLSNHPYEAGIPHTPDLGLIAPVYVDGVRVGFSGTIAHKSDFGGAVVGSASMGSTHLFQEGLLIPPVLAERDGVWNPVINQIINANVRNTDMFFGDMRAQIGITKVGVERLKQLARNTGVETLLGVYRELLDQGERTIRSAIATWPDGEVTVEGFMDNDGVNFDKPVRLEVKVAVKGDTLTLDTSGSDDQTTGPVNQTPTFVESGLFYMLIAFTDPSAGFNDGMRRAVNFIGREGSVLNPRPPAPVGAATSMQARYQDLVAEALSFFVPTHSIANSGGGGGANAILWDTGGESGARSLMYEVPVTGRGAMLGKDGTSGCTAWGTGTMTSVEILESQFPMRIRRFELIRDSGGPGKWRGGLSVRREYEAIRPAQVNRRGERAKFPGRGLEGGLPGSLARVTLISADGTEKILPVSGRYQLVAGDILRIETSGAGGMGDPLERPAEAVLGDVLRGYVSLEQALDSYGVVISDTGSLDESASAALRSTKAKSAATVTR